MKLTKKHISKLFEGALFIEGKPMSAQKLRKLLPRDQRPPLGEVREILTQLQKVYQNKGVQLVEVASGFRFQACEEVAGLLVEHQEVKPMRFSKAFMETLALVAYRQPITRGEIEDIRGVAVSTNIIKSLLELEWIREVGHKDVPGKPALFATTRKFLDFFNLKTLEDLPPLAELEELSETRMSEEYQMLDQQINSEWDRARVLNEESMNLMGPFLPGQEPKGLNQEATAVASDFVGPVQFEMDKLELSEAEVKEYLDEEELSETDSELGVEEDEAEDDHSVFGQSSKGEEDDKVDDQVAWIDDSLDHVEASSQRVKPEGAKTKPNLLEEEWGELDDFDLLEEHEQVTGITPHIKSETQTKEFDDIESEAGAANHRPLEDFTDIVLTRSFEQDEDPEEDINTQDG